MLAAIIISLLGAVVAGDSMTTGTGVSVDCAVTRVSGKTDA
jgi:hypothetical protein